MAELRVTIGHVGVCVPDLDHAVEWYRHVLGLELLDGPRELVAESARAEVLRDVFGSTFRRARVAQLGSASAAGLELFEFIDPPRKEALDSSYFRPGFSHLCFVAEDFEGTVGRIATSGGGRIRTTVWPEYVGKPYRFVHFEDPFGNLLELHSHPHREMVGARGESPPEAR